MKPVLLRLSLLAGFILLAGLFPALVSAAGEPVSAAISESQYWDLVDSSQQAVLDLKPDSAVEIRRGLDRLAAQWQAVTAVTLADGRTVTIDNSYLLTVLAAPDPDLNRLENIFSSLKAAHKAYPSRVFTTKDIESLKQILARPEFRGLSRQVNPFSQWLQNLWMRLMNWFGDLMQRLFGNRNVTIGDGAGSPLELISIVILILILLYAAHSLYADFVAEADLKEDGSGSGQPLTAESAFEKAQALSRGGDYRSAVRYLYLSSLLVLDERGLLRYDHSKTNREVLRSVSDSPELARRLHDVIEVFDNVWYGYHTLDEDSFRHYSQRVEELKEKKK
jgi:Domain of unknown function (DUF4129)